jgi:hypothetical protein
MRDLGYTDPWREAQVSHALGILSQGNAYAAAHQAHSAVTPQDWRIIIGAAINN